MTLEVDVFWSFRSPWSYLATPRLAGWQREYHLEVNFRPVYPIAIRTPEFIENANPMFGPYFMRDVHRVAEFLELPFQWANPDPVAMVPSATGRQKAADEQPFIHRLTRLGARAEELGRGIEFAEQVSALIWSTNDWDQGDTLADAVDRTGLDLACLDTDVVEQADRLDTVIESNEAAHTAAGHWGVPMCAFEGEPFFGQDRLDVLLWRLKRAGLRRRV